MMPTCTHHYIIITEELTALKTPCTPPIHPFVLCPQTLVTTYLLTVSRVLPFPGCHIAGIIQCTPFSDWLLSFSNNHLRFLSFFMACRLIFFNYWILFHHMDIPQFTHLFPYWRVSSLLLTTVFIFYFIKFCFLHKVSHPWKYTSKSYSEKGWKNITKLHIFHFCLFQIFYNNKHILLNQMKFYF